jgi:DNA-binding CsgD family transcriptional regulator
LYARAEGNPFFTEQLVAAALVDAGGELRVPAGLPARLAELLTARAGRCGDEARQVLAALSVAARPLAEDLLGAVTGLDVDAMRRALRELAAARLLADDTPGGAHRPRHALLAEAVASGLLPGERMMLHERTARALQATGDQTLAAEVAGHWQAAARPAEELPARVAAAEAAERVFGYAEAAGHWLRAIELCQASPAVAGAAGIDLPGLYLRAIEAMYQSGDAVHSGELAEEACRQFAGHPDAATVAVFHHFAARRWASEDPATGLPLIKEALRLFEQSAPSAEHARAAFDYATWFLFYEGQREAGMSALGRAQEIAEAACPAQIPLILAVRASDAFLRGQAEEGFAMVQRARTLALAAGDGPVLLFLATQESNDLVKMGRFRSAADVALRGLQAAREIGLEGDFGVAPLAYNAGAALVALGRTAEAAALIDPLTCGPPGLDSWVAHEAHAEIDLLRGDIASAAERLQQNPLRGRGVDDVREAARQAAEVSLWAGRPRDALDEIQRVLARFTAPDLTFFCGRLLAAGMRACADLAEQARARRDEPAAEDAVDAADRLVAWVGRMGGAPFTDHPAGATIPAERATWEAERTRLAGASDPAAWSGAAKAWQDLGCPHRAGYAWWRQAQAQLDGGQPATAAAGVLRAAAAAADGHAPLLAQIRLLAERARIPLHDPTAASPGAPPPAEMARPYGLTARELAVLRLVAAGWTNSQIGAELYISPRTAGVHVTNILRKLGVANRVQAAALAERAGLIPSSPV